MRKTLATALILLGGLLMGGCINMKVSTNVGEDGSGTWSFGFYFDEAAFNESMGGMGAMFGADTAGTDTTTEDSGSMTSDMTSDLAGTFGEDLSEIYTDEATGIAISAETKIENEDEEWIYFNAFVPNAEAWSSLEAVFTAATESGEDSTGTDTIAEDPLGMGVDPASAASDLELFPTVTFEGDTVRVAFEGASPAETFGLADMGDMSGLGTDTTVGTGTDSAAIPGMEGMEDMMTMMFGSMFEGMSVQYEVIVAGEVVETNGVADPETGAIIYDVDMMSSEPLNFFVVATR